VRNEGDVDLEAKARLYRALGDPSRLAVLELLREGPKHVSDLVAMTRLSQPNVSGHLAFLRDCSLVKREQRGRYAYYAISTTSVEAILASTDSFLRSIIRGVAQSAGLLPNSFVLMPDSEYSRPFNQEANNTHSQPE
jgi:DNA-binding transcriptional ArsR family regulator